MGRWGLFAALPFADRADGGVADLGQLALGVSPRWRRISAGVMVAPGGLWG